MSTALADAASPAARFDRDALRVDRRSHRCRGGAERQKGEALDLIGLLQELRCHAALKAPLPGWGGSALTEYIGHCPCAPHFTGVNEPLLEELAGLTDRCIVRYRQLKLTPAAFSPASGPSLPSPPAGRGKIEDSQ